MDRPSLFSSYPVNFSPFSAVNQIGASGGVSSGVSSGDNAQILTQMANAEVRRQLEERVRASMVGTNVGAEVFHIGSPSDRTGSEFQSVRSRSTHSLSHPTTSPAVSFGPIGSPSISGNPIPEGAVSSPGLMSDVGSAGASFCAGVPSLGSGGRIPTPPGLPLSDPPRVTGAYGVTAYDPDFGLGCRGEGVEPKASIPPPPPGDPYVQLLESQSAMSMLMMQMAREMNQRSQQLLPPQQPQQGVPTPQPCQAAGQPVGQAEPARGMRMDEKWIPAMPTPPWTTWHTRGRELSGFKDWLEKFCGWLCLIQDAYGPELAEAINASYQIQPTRSPEQTMQSKRLFHLLQQNFVGYSKIENLIRSQISSSGITESNGFELLRLIRMEFSLMSRTEALNYREQCLKFRVRRGLDHLPDIVREVETEIESFHAMLDASVIVGQLGDVRISEGDQFLLCMRNLPSKVQEFLQLHQNATTVNQIKIGVQDYHIRTRVQGDLGTVHVAQPVQKAADLKDRTCFNCGKKGHLAENCPEPKKCSHCGKKGHVAKDCWEKHPDKKPKPKPKSQSSNSKGKGKGQTGGRGRGKGGRKAKGRGRGNKFRTVDGEEEYEEGEDDYEDEDEPEGDEGEDPEPEGEDPSGSVNHINQMTMCIRGKSKTSAVAASSSSTERVVSESHRVDEINLVEKLSHYKVVYRYEVGIPVLKGAGDNVLPTRGMVDLECKVGQIKVIMRKVVICALDSNVLSSYSLHEQGWETRLGTLKVSGLYHKKVKFPLKISDRAWWLEVLVLKHQGKSSRRKDNGPKDMEVDHVGVVHSNSSSKACHSKDVVTKVAPAKEQEPAVQTSLPTKDGSFIASVSAEENVGYFKNMRRECQVKTFDGLGPFSYVCRMIRVSEPNTKEFDQRVLVDSAFEEHVEGDQHYVHVVNPERVRGFPVEIDLEEGENNPEGLNDDENENVLDEAEVESGYVPTTPPKSDQGSDRESAGKRPREGAEEKLVPGPPDPEDPDDPEGGDSDDPSKRNMPELEGNLLFQHESRGHWPYDCGCDACVQARGRTPARRVRKKNEGDQRSAIQLAADYTYIAGRHWRLLILLMLHTQMMGIVVMTGDRDNDIKSVASVLNEIGVGGLNIEVATDNERYLVDMVSRGLAKSNARAYHWRNISEYRPQAKGVERAVGIAKEGIYTNWLAFESKCQCRIGLESPLLGYLVGYVYRTFNIFCDRYRSGTPLERMREARGGQKPASFPFGMIGFAKPVLLGPWKGQRMVLCCYLGMRYVTGGGVLVFPVNPDSNGNREVIRCHSFRIREGVQYDVNAVWPLLAGVRPNDPNLAQPFC